MKKGFTIFQNFFSPAAHVRSIPSYSESSERFYEDFHHFHEFVWSTTKNYARTYCCLFFKEWNEALVKKLIFWISSTHTFQILCDTLKDFLKEGIISERKTLLFTSFLGLLKKSLEIKVGWGILEKLLWHQQVIFLRKSQKSFHKGGRLLWLNYPEQVYRTRHLLMCMWERSGFHFGQPLKLYEIS